MIFTELGFDDVYDNFPSRWNYAQSRLIDLNNRGEIEKFIKFYLHPERILEESDEKLISETIEIVNKYLLHDGFRVILKETNIEIEKLDGSIVESKEIKKINNDFILEHIEKCENKIKNKDFSGAITSSRSLLESILKYLYKEIFKEEAGNKKLPDLYSEVVKKLKIHNTSEIDDGLKKIAGGLNASVIGISEVRNRSSDSHGGINLKYKVEEHHALLVVNATKTITQFLFQSYKKQNK